MFHMEDTGLVRHCEILSAWMKSLPDWLVKMEEDMHELCPFKPSLVFSFTNVKKVDFLSASGDWSASSSRSPLCGFAPGTNCLLSANGPEKIIKHTTTNIARIKTTKIQTLCKGHVLER